MNRTPHRSARLGSCLAAAIFALSACGGPADGHDDRAGSARDALCSAGTTLALAAQGTSVTLTATACATAPEYRFGVRAPGSATYTVARDYAPDPTFAWDGAGKASGRYYFIVWVRERGASTASTASATHLVGSVCTVATVQAAPGAGAVTRLSATATCAAGTVPEFQFLAKAPGEAAYSELRPYGSAATFDWDTTGLAAGRYDVIAYARATGNGSIWEAAGGASQLVGRVCTSATLAAAPGDAGAVSLSATAACGGATPEFQFMARGPGEEAFHEVRPYGAAPTFAWDTVGLAAGRWDVLVRARVAGSASTHEATASAAQLVGPVCSTATLEAAAVAGSVVALSASATCPAGAAPEYRFLAKAPGEAAYRELRPYGAGASFTWDTAGLAAGRWDVLVYARAAGHGSLYEAWATRTQLVGPVCTAAAIQASPGAGATVTLSASATCAAGAVAEYAFLARAPGEAAYRELRPYGAAATFAWDTAGLVAGRYDVLAYVRAVGNGSTYEVSAGRSQLVGRVCTSATLAVTPGAGGLVNLSAAAACDGGAAPEFRFLVRGPGEAAFREVRTYGAAPAFAWDTSRTAGGRYEVLVYARVFGNASSYEAYRAAWYTVVGCAAGVPSALAFTVPPAASATAGQPLAPVRVALLDGCGAPVAGSPVAIGLSIGTGPDGATLRGGAPAVATFGEAVFSELVLERAGRYTLVASADGVPPNTSPELAVDPGAPAAAFSSLTISPSRLVADGVSAATVTATVRDAFANPVAGVAVELAAADASLEQPAVPTDSAGVAIGSIAASAPGTRTVTASAGAVVLASAAVAFDPHDTATPVTTAAPAGGTYAAAGASVVLACADDVSGCAGTWYALSPGDWRPYQGPVALAATGDLCFYSKDAAGNAEAPRCERYVVDAVAPWVVATDPAAGAVGVSDVFQPVVAFSEPMDPASTAAAITLSGPAGAVPATITPDAAGELFTVAPAAPLARVTTYALNVGTGARDAAGNPLAAAHVASFTTRLMEDQVSGPGSATLTPGGLAFDAAGNGLAVWETAAHKVLYACYDAPSGLWAAARVLDGDGGKGRPKVAASSSGFGVAWEGGSPGIQVSIFTGCTPGPIQTLTTGSYGSELAIASNGTGYVVAWSGTQGGSYAAVWNGNAWTTKTFTTTTGIRGLSAIGDGTTGYRLVYEYGAAYSVRYLPTYAMWEVPISLGNADTWTIPAVATASGITCVAWTNSGSVSVRIVGVSGTSGTTYQDLIRTLYRTPVRVAVNAGKCLVAALDTYGAARASLFNGSYGTTPALISGSAAATDFSLAPHGTQDFSAVAIVGGDLWANRLTGGVWGTANLVESGAEPVRTPLLVRASTSLEHLLFTQGDTSADRLWSARWDSANVSAVEPRSPTGFEGSATEPLLATAANGDVLAVWTQQHRGWNSVFGALRRAGVWGEPLLIATDGSVKAVASNGSDFMVAYLSGSTLLARRLSGDILGAPAALSATGYEPKDLSMASDGAGYAITYTVWAGATGYEPRAVFHDGTTWLAPVTFVTGGKLNTKSSVGGRPGEYLFFYMYDTGTQMNVYALRANGSGASWKWGPTVGLYSNAGYRSVSIAAGPNGFGAVFNGSTTTIGAVMVDGAWSPLTALRSTTSDSWAIASNGSGYLVVTANQNTVDGTQAHPWVAGSWRTARTLVAASSPMALVSVASDGMGYAVVRMPWSLPAASLIRIAEPISGAIAAPVQLHSTPLFIQSYAAPPVVWTPGGYVAAWAASDPADAGLTRVYARGGL